MTLQAVFADQLERLLPDPVGPIGLAVSGGSDSMALMLLAADWAKTRGAEVRVVTIDHGLRPESAAEAAMVARMAADLGLTHDTLHWTNWSGQGNLQAEARAARYRLIDGWRGDIAHVLTGHTLDDQAETVLMRLARGSGVDGLAAMRPSRWQAGQGGGYHILRPLLTTRREALREMLRDRGVTWADDPSNDNPAYDRVRARQALAALAPLGITADGLAETAQRMQRASEALRQRASEVAQRLAQVQAGDVLFDLSALEKTDAETRLRLLSAALSFVGGQDYRPRAAALSQAWDQAASGHRANLQGCLMTPAKGQLRISREPQAVQGQILPFHAGALWDGRWQIDCPEAPTGTIIMALGEAGLAQAGPRPDDLPYQSALAMPGLWHDGALLAAPTLGWGLKSCAALTPARADFHRFLLSH